VVRPEPQIGYLGCVLARGSTASLEIFRAAAARETSNSHSGGRNIWLEDDEDYFPALALPPPEVERLAFGMCVDIRNISYAARSIGRRRRNLAIKSTRLVEVRFERSWDLPVDLGLVAANTGAARDLDQIVRASRS
jgi:hypothetical protein